MDLEDPTSCLRKNFISFEIRAPESKINRNESNEMLSSVCLPATFRWKNNFTNYDCQNFSTVQRSTHKTKSEQIWIPEASESTLTTLVDCLGNACEKKTAGQNKQKAIKPIGSDAEDRKINMKKWSNQRLKVGRKEERKKSNVAKKKWRESISTTPRFI